MKKKVFNWTEKRKASNPVLERIKDALLEGKAFSSFDREEIAFSKQHDSLCMVMKVLDENESSALILIPHVDINFDLEEIIKQDESYFGKLVCMTVPVSDLVKVSIETIEDED